RLRGRDARANRAGGVDARSQRNVVHRRRAVGDGAVVAPGHHRSGLTRLHRRAGAPVRFPRRLTAAAIAVIAALSGTAARAWWADTATATATAAAHAVVSQAQPVCENTPALLGLLGSARFTWTHVDDRYVYD